MQIDIQIPAGTPSGNFGIYPEAESERMAERSSLDSSDHHAVRRSRYCMANFAISPLGPTAQPALPEAKLTAL